MKKKFCSALTTAALCASYVMPVYDFSAYALYANNFNHSYTITGDGAKDIVDIALKQQDRSKSQMGYTIDWCAAFVSDCANLAGQSEAVPSRTWVRDLKPAILSSGGYEVNSAQAGDILFYYCNRCNDYVHVGLMIDSIHSIQGNYGGKVSYVQNPSYYYDVYEHSCSSGSVVYSYVRPNYNGKIIPIIPSKPTISATGGTATATSKFSWNACENAEEYDLFIYPKGSSTVLLDTIVKSTSKEIALPPGDYSVAVASVNNTHKTYTFSDRADFSVGNGEFKPTAVTSYNGHI